MKHESRQLPLFMMSYEKKHPALIDTDRMPFGKHKGIPMSDVPPSYLRWLFYNIQENGITKNNELVYNYIWNSKDALEMELGSKL